MPEKSDERALFNAVTTPSGFEGAALLLQNKVARDQAVTAEDIANSVRDPLPAYPGAAVGVGRVDPNYPPVSELLKNLPDDLEYIPNHPAGPMLRLRKGGAGIPMS